MPLKTVASAWQHAQELAADLGTMVVAGFAFIMAAGGLITAWVKWGEAKRVGVEQVAAAADAEQERLSEVLRAQVEAMATGQDEMLKQLVNLEGKVDRMMGVIVALTCLNAPGCERRDCPAPALIAELVGGTMSIEDIGRLKDG